MRVSTLHTLAYASIRQHTSAYVSIHQHTSGATESPSQDSINARLDAAKGKLAAAQQRVAAAYYVAALEKELSQLDNSSITH
jgi:hypothetical protein